LHEQLARHLRSS